MIPRNFLRLLKLSGPCLVSFVIGVACHWIFGGNQQNQLQLENELPLFPDPPVTLLVLVTSAPGNTAVRQTIRGTWLSKEDAHVRHFFVVGDRNLNSKQAYDLSLEKEEHRDLMVLPMFDSYATLTNKVLKSLEFSQKNFKFDFLLKCDDDTFVDLARVLEELNQNPDPLLYWGFFDGRAPVMTKGKWADPSYRLCDHYVPYALGGGYVLGKSVVEFVASNSRLLVEYNSEDVSLGTWLAGTKVNRKHDPRFDTEWKSRGCNNKFLVTHKQTPGDMEVKWRRLVKSGTICDTEETKVRLSYNYQWDKPPSQCCARVDHTLP